MAKAQENGAPDSVVSDLQRLPGEEFSNVQDVCRAIGIGTEADDFRG